MKNLIIFFLILGLYSCKKEYQTFSKNIIIIQKSVKNLNNRTVNEKDIINSEILYIGKIKDSVELENHLFLPPPPKPLLSSNEDSTLRKNRLKKEKIWGDLMKYLKNSNKYKLINKENVAFEFNEKDTIMGYDNFRGDFDSIIHYKSFPIFVKNISKDTISLGTDGYFPILVEAKNKSGSWIEINKLPIICGTGSYDVVCLPPNEMIVTSMFHYTGNFKTKLRLKFLDFISREFDGNVNEQQLK